MSDSIRPVVSSEYQTALDLWCDVFGVEPEYFRRYYHGDPFYRPGDTLGAWVDGTLAAAVHVVRRPVLWRGRTITMAGIANVATRPEYRSRGLSTTLLTALWKKIEGDDFDFGQLGTGIPPFYERLGWESVPMGLFQVNMERAVPHATGVCEEVGASFDLLPLYRRGARPLAIARTPEYMAQWVSYDHHKIGTYTWVLGDLGYIVIRLPGDSGGSAEVHEWIADDAEVEEILIRQALAAAQDHKASLVTFEGMPQFLNPAFFGEIAGSVAYEPNSGAMVRNLRLDPDDYAALKDEMLSGQAALWTADHY